MEDLHRLNGHSIPDVRLAGPNCPTNRSADPTPRLGQPAGASVVVARTGQAPPGLITCPLQSPPTAGQRW